MDGAKDLLRSVFIFVWRARMFIAAADVSLEQEVVLVRGLLQELLP